LPFEYHVGSLDDRSAAAPSLLTHKDQAAPFVAIVSWSERSRPRQQVDYHDDLSIYRQLPEALD